MKQFIKLAVASIALAFSATAGAEVIGQTYNANNLTIAAGSFATHTFDFTGSPYNFVAATEDFDWAKLTFRVRDITGNSTGDETFSFLVGPGNVLLGGGSNVGNGNTSFGPFTIDSGSLASLSTTGMLSVRVQSDTGTSFRWVDAVLEANRIPAPAEVPEPLSVALFGLGLAGIAAARRKS